mmetsp:Transcript_872/g.2039  ORF Transcript_872/g.2039 Transcript_872/m.2039 type:complete len:307 (-) Transcript_872:172-1092(-)
MSARNSSIAALICPEYCITGNPGCSGFGNSCRNRNWKPASWSTWLWRGLIFCPKPVPITKTRFWLRGTFPHMGFGGSMTNRRKCREKSANVALFLPFATELKRSLTASKQTSSFNTLPPSTPGRTKAATVGSILTASTNSNFEIVPLSSASILPKIKRISSMFDASGEARQKCAMKSAKLARFLPLATELNIALTASKLSSSFIKLLHSTPGRMKLATVLSRCIASTSSSIEMAQSPSRSIFEKIMRNSAALPSSTAFTALLEGVGKEATLLESRGDNWNLGCMPFGDARAVGEAPARDVVCGTAR